MKVKKGDFVVIVGEVGCGKTSLLATMIGEMIHIPQNEIDFVGDQMRKIQSDELKALEHTLLMQDFTHGESPVTVAGTTGFVESQHWIQNGKFRDNICFGSEFDERKYVETVLACQFETDLKLMPAGKSPGPEGWRGDELRLLPRRDTNDVIIGGFLPGLLIFGVYNLLYNV